MAVDLLAEQVRRVRDERLLLELLGRPIVEGAVTVANAHSIRIALRNDSQGIRLNLGSVQPLRHFV